MQNEVLRCIAKAPWYVANDTFHRDLLLDTIDETIKKRENKYSARLHKHRNVEAIRLLDLSEATRRLKRVKPIELIN